MRERHDLPKLEPRAPGAHKGDFGRVLLVGGSRGMAGAIGLAGLAALRSGAGLVRLGVPQGVLATVAGYEPSYMTVGLGEDSAGRLGAGAWSELESVVGGSDVVACGPGWGRSEELARLGAAMYCQSSVPTVFDADALFALAQQRQDLGLHAAPRIVTPHEGEFRRLLGAGAPDSRSEVVAAAHNLARDAQLVLVLKGHRTLVTDGNDWAENETGNPGMATGGTGDVLTGVIAALVAQGLGCWEAARLGVHVHGLAGDFAARELGEISLIASDLVRFLPRAFRACCGEGGAPSA
jgi:ADP-dependent NAD(P)H-hydrate dehydratase